MSRPTFKEKWILKLVTRVTRNKVDKSIMATVYNRDIDSITSEVILSMIEMTSCIAGTCTPLAIGPRDLPEITANLSLKIHLVDPIFKQLIKLRHSRSLKIITVSRVNDNIKTDKQASSVCSWKDPKVRIRV